MYYGDFAVNSIVRLMWNSNAVAGESITRATNGSIRIYKNNSTTERTSANGITDSEDFDTLTGVHHVNIDTSDNTDAGFYAAGNDYFVVLAAATIDGKTINAYLGSFSIENRNVKANVTQWNGSTPNNLTGGRVESIVGAYASGQAPLQPTVAGRTFDVTATGCGGVDWGNLENAGSTVNLSATTIATLSGDVQGKVLGGGASAISGIGAWANGTSGSDIATSTNQTTILNRLGAFTGSGANTILGVLRALARKDATLPSDLGGTFAVATHSLEAIKDNQLDAAISTRLAPGGNVGNVTGDVQGKVLGGGASAISNIGAWALGTSGSDLATSTNQTTILNRLGAFTGSGANTILGVLRALARKDATLPSDIGGTFAVATDSLEALRDDLATVVWTPANMIETGITPQLALRYIGATCAGLLSGAGTTTEVFTGMDLATTRVTATVDANGNRPVIVFS